MRPNFATRTAYVQQMDQPLRCRCPECLSLDARFPTEGYQLALIPYVISTWRGQGSRP